MIRMGGISMVVFVPVRAGPVLRYQGITFTVGNLFDNLKGK